MSFPHRTAIYDDKHKKIFYPSEIYSNQLIDPEGTVWIVETREASMEEIAEKFESDDCLDDYNHRMIAVTQRFTKLASTGLEDSEENEIFEGHILSQYDEYGVVVYKHGAFSTTASTPDYFRNVYDQWEIIGHALTDPQLVPDSFDTEEYFELK